MNIVVVDSAHLAGEADFPMLNWPKYGWQQFPALSGAELAERCWRSDVVITVDTPIDSAVLDQAFKLALVAVAGESTAHIDTATLKARNIALCHVPGGNPADPAHTASICNETIANIAAFLHGEARNRLL